jgi:hypothetical protein
VKLVTAPFGAVTELLLSLEDVNEDDQEHEVDEVHGFNETNGQEEVRTSLVLDLGLTRDGGNRLATSQTVTNRRTDSTAAEGEAATDQGTSVTYRVCDV